MTRHPDGRKQPPETDSIPTFTYEPGKRRKPTGLIIGAVVGVLVLVGGALFVVLGGESEPTPASPTPDVAVAAAPGTITAQGDQIMRDGEPWWFLGYNSFMWSGDCGEDG